MKKRLYLKNQNMIFRCANIFISNQRGAILITLIVSMVVVAGLGSAMVSMFATSTHNQFGSSNSIKAHYLAESGKMIGIKYADDGGNITDLNGDIYTLSNGDTFKFSNTVYNSNADFSFDSTGTTGGISRMISFARTIGSTNLASDPNNELSDPDGDDGDEAYDGDCDNRGYRSRLKGTAVSGNSSIGYDFGQSVQIFRINLIQDANDIDNNISSILVQGSDDSSFASIGASTPISADKNWTPGGCDFDVINLPTNLGAYQYWRLLANSNPANGEEWHVNELRVFGPQDTQT